MIRFFLLAAILIGLVSTGCNVINPAEKAPTYLKIDSFSFSNPDPGITGTASHKITSAWVYLNNQIVGVFDLPAVIPIIAEKVSQVQITPGITFSGMKNFQATYPFYVFDTIAITPQAGKVIEYTPKTKYKSTAKFRYKEDFEVGNTFIKANSDNTDDTSIVRTNDKSKVLEGTGAGYIYLTKTHSYCQNVNNTDLIIGKGESYFELNYKCNVDFEVWLSGAKADGTVGVVLVGGAKANENWNKLYFGLEAPVGTLQGVKYRILIKTSLPSDKTDGYVLLDNLKVVSY